MCLPGTTEEYIQDKRRADSSPQRPLLVSQRDSGRCSIYLNLTLNLPQWAYPYFNIPVCSDPII